MTRYIRVGTILFLAIVLAVSLGCSRTVKEIGMGTGDVGPTGVIEGEDISGDRYLDGTLYGLQDINFEFDKSSLTGQAQEILRENAQWLADNPTVNVEIEGHCDERGTIEYNLALGDRRAKSARDFLINLGVSASRLSTISYGEEMPLDAGHNESAWAKNRRAHFTIIAK
jgi:peptidoglycan-associated lipoprotein